MKSPEPMTPKHMPDRMGSEAVHFETIPFNEGLEVGQSIFTLPVTLNLIGLLALIVVLTFIGAL